MEEKKKESSSSEDDSGASIQPISYRYLAAPHIMQQIYADMVNHYYWTEDWRPETYISGFIAVSLDQGSKTYLLPEIQKSYSILDWNDLHLSGSVKRRAKHYTLSINDSLEDVLNGIDKHHKSNWVGDSYKKIFRTLMSKPEWKIPLPGTQATFKAHCVTLRHKETGAVVAGEIGYSIGATYTSLTGFFDTEKVAGSTQLKYTSAGKVQLIALGKLLEENGYQCWNLGHPYRETEPYSKSSMMYKKEIGAHIEKRHDFLIRWKAATNALPESNLSIRQTDTDAIIRGGVIDPKWTVAELKEKGDAMLKEGKTNKAIKFYTAALSKDKQTKELWGNRSLSYLVNNNFKSALDDANSAIAVDSTWARGYLRKAAALQALGRKAEALSACEEGLKAVPSDESLINLKGSLQ